MEYLLLSKISTNNLIYDIGIILIILPLLTALKKYFEDDFPQFIKNKYNNKWTYIGYSGLETIAHAYFSYSVSTPFISLCHYITMHNLAKQNYHRNDNRLEFISNGHNIYLTNGIYADISTDLIKTPEDRYTTSIKQVTITIKSKTHNFNDLQKFVNECSIEYKKYREVKNADKLYHFIYQTCQNETDPIFSKTVLSDLYNVEAKSYETFETIFSEHKESLKGIIDRLKDDKYYIKTGAKRKAGFLFHGIPGCGKTAHVTAIANYDNRHIIEVPMSRVKTNIQLENILTITEINGVAFKRNQIIFLFDEIDQCFALKPRKNEKENIRKNIDNNNDGIDKKELKNILKLECSDQLNLGFILSRLDGIGNYAGLIIIATTNCIQSLSPALYREGRLTPMEFSYCRHEDIVNIIEYRYDIKLSADELLKIPDKTHKLTPTKLVQLLDKNYANKPELFVELNMML